MIENTVTHPMINTPHKNGLMNINLCSLSVIRESEPYKSEAADSEITWQCLVAILVLLHSYLRRSRPARPTEREEKNRYA